MSTTSTTGSPGRGERTLSPGAALVRALAAGDDRAAWSLLSDEVDFAALVPTRLIELHGRDATLAKLREWFPHGGVEALEHVEEGAVGPRGHVGYRVRWHEPDGPSQVFEQHAYYDAGPSGIRSLRLVCSGDHFVAAQ